MVSAVAEADRLVRVRATLFYLMAATFMASSLIGLKAEHTAAQLGLWMFLAVLTAANLTPIGGWMKPQAVRRLMNDETTREHRRTSLVAGFWTSVVAALGLALAARTAPLPADDVARLIVTTSLSVALVVFATLELRAGRG
jgi:uncharacterized membrane protein (DUF441 family)